MSIVLFAILGANMGASTAYWICFGVYCVIEVAQAIKAVYDD